MTAEVERSGLVKVAATRQHLHVDTQHAAFVRLMKRNEQLLSQLGEHTHAVINGLLGDVNMASTAPWIYLSLKLFERGGERRARGLCVASGEHLGIGPDSIGHVELDMPYPWTDQQRGYHLDVFGHQILPNDEVGQYPFDAVWTLTFAGDVVTQLVAWRCRAFRLGASTFAETAWRPNWDKVGTTWSGDLDPGVFPEPAAIGQTLLRDIQKRGVGAPRKSRSKKLDKLAKDGLKWLRDHPGYDIEDVGREQLAEARHRMLGTIDEYMRANRFINDDVHRRMRELLGEEHGENSSSR